MLSRLTKFINNEQGAITVDWVALTAAVVAFSAFAFSLISNVTQTHVTATSDAMTDYEINGVFATESDQ